MTDIPPAPVNQGWVVMFHPDLDDPDGNHVYAEVTREAFDLVWAEKGFVEAKAADAFAGFTKTELQDAARERGLDDSGTAAQLRERLAGTGGEG